MTYTECPLCGAKSFQVWDQASVDAWYKEHLKICKKNQPSEENKI